MNTLKTVWLVFMLSAGAMFIWAISGRMGWMPLFLLTAALFFWSLLSKKASLRKTGICSVLLLVVTLIPHILPEP